MKLLVLIALLLVFQWKTVWFKFQAWGAFNFYMRWCEKLCGKQQWYQSGLGLGAVVIIASFIVISINKILPSEILQLIFQVFVVVWLMVRLSTYQIEKLNLQALPGVVDGQALTRVPPSVWTVNYVWVAPIFWYLFTGLLGITAYVLLAFLQQNGTPYWRLKARMALEVLAWIPARFLGLAYGLVGNMQAGLKMWGEVVAAGMPYNAFFLEACALSSLLVKSSETQESAFQRVQRDALILLLGVYSLMALLGWFL